MGEESTEVIIAGKAGDKRETIYEIADLTYHLLVLMIEMGISLDEIRDELASRHVIDKKNQAGKDGIEKQPHAMRLSDCRGTPVLLKQNWGSCSEDPQKTVLAK